jgi:outer membrane protein assembly factor BamE
MRYFLILIAVLAIFGLAGCGSTLPKATSFKMDIQQGNVVTSKMLLKLRPGMTKRQVKYIMGTPLIEDSFHNNRWDYFYQLRKEGKIISQRRVILDFEQELLARVRGDVVPEGTPGADTGEAMLSASEIKPEEKSTIDKLKFWKKDKVAEETKPVEEKSAEVLEPVAVPPELSEVKAPPTVDAEEMADVGETVESEV